MAGSAEQDGRGSDHRQVFTMVVTVLHDRHIRTQLAQARPPLLGASKTACLADADVAMLHVNHTSRLLYTEGGDNGAASTGQWSPRPPSAPQPPLSLPSVLYRHIHVQLRPHPLQRRPILCKGEASLRVCRRAQDPGHDAVQLVVAQRAARQLAQHDLHVVARHRAVACGDGGRICVCA